MFEERAPSPCANASGLSRDFGLDITVPDGGLVTSAANQKQYQAECSRIYQQFILNMADYINEEAQLRKTLTLLQSQKKLSPRKATLKSNNPDTPKTPDMPRTPDMPDEDAFTHAQLEEFKNILNRESSRSLLSHASAFAAADSATTNAPDARGQTPKLGHAKSVSSLVNQPPVTHMFPALKERPPSVKANQLRRDSKGGTSQEGGEKKRAASASLFGTDVEYDGIMEHNAELSSNRRIRMNPRAFTKLMTGQVRVKLLNKTGDFVLTPISPGTAVLQQEEPDKQMMIDNKEKVAVVRQRTTFQSPTLSSDLKISNLVAIQKALKGQSAKRVTVGEVMKSARDRKSRLFRVQMSGNRFDEFDQHVEDIGYVHEVKAALDLGEAEVPEHRSPSRVRGSPHLHMLRQQSETRPESRLRTPTPIPLHILDPQAAGRCVTPGILKQTSHDFSGLAVHKDCSDFELRYSQAVDEDNRSPAKERAKQKMSVIHIGFDEPDTEPRPAHSAFRSLSAAPPPFLGEKRLSRPHTGGIFPVSKQVRARTATTATAVTVSGQRRQSRSVKTPTGARRERSLSPPTAAAQNLPLKKINNMRDTACVVKRWQEEDKEREENLNRWRMRMSFAATRRGNLAKVLTRSKSGC